MTMAGVSVVELSPVVELVRSQCRSVVELVETHRAGLDKLDHRTITRPPDFRSDHRTAPSA